MVVLAGKHASNLVQGRAADDLCLRVVGTARNGQVVKLSAPKCTIGSAQGCTLRLQAVGVRPLHCVILRGSRGTVARCWSAGTRLNGQRFDDAPLAAGDRLMIGPIELEVLSSSATEVLRGVAASENQAAACPSSPSESTESHSQNVHVARQRVRKLIAAIRGLRAKMGPLREQTDHVAPDDQRVRATSHDLECRLEAFQRDCQSWESSRTATQAELEARESRLATELGQLETARIALARDQQRGEQESIAAFRDLEERDAAHRQSQQQFAFVQAAFEEQRAAWSTDKARAGTEVELQRSELLKERDEAARLVQDLERQRALLTAQFAAQLAQLEQEQAAWRALQAEEELGLAAEWANLAEQQAQQCRAQEQFEQSQQAAREENGQAAAQLAAARQSLDQERLEFQGRATEHDALFEQRRAELESRGSELEESRKTLAQRAAQQAQSESQHQAAGDEVPRLKAEIERQAAANREQLEAERAAWQRDREVLEAQRQQLQKGLDGLGNEPDEQLRKSQQEQAELAQAHSKLERALADLRDEREALDDERMKAASRMARETEELERQRTELEVEREAFTDERASRARTSDEDRMAEENRDPHEAPISPTLETEPDEMEAQAEECMDTVSDQEDASNDEPGAQRGGPQHHNEEPSVEEYMKGLLSRMRGGMPAEVAPAPQPRRNKRKSDPSSQAEQPKTESAAAVSRPTPVVDMPSAPAEMTRRPALRQTTDLTAMRELANTQARIHIDLHGKKRLLRIVLGSLTAAILALTATFAVLILISDDDALRTGSMVGIVAGVYWMFGGAKALQQMMSLNQATLADSLTRAQEAEARKLS